MKREVVTEVTTEGFDKKEAKEQAKPKRAATLFRFKNGKTLLGVRQQPIPRQHFEKSHMTNQTC